MERSSTQRIGNWPESVTQSSGFSRLDAEPFPAFEPGWVWLVGAGPGAPGLMSLLCYHALQSCDVVVYDALVNPDILRWVKAGAELEYAGKRGGKPSPTQSDITLRLIDLARLGKRVLRLKGGDPFMFGRGGEECQHLAAAAIPFRIVPGITAGIGGLAYAGMPATHRDTNHSVLFLTGHDANGNMAVDRNVVYGYAYWEARVFSAGGFITRKNWTDGDAVGAVGNEWLNDEAGRLKSISGRITSLAYNARGQVTVAVYANGVTTTNAYNDQRGWLTNVSTVNRANF